MVRPGVSVYSLSKMAAFQMMPFIAAENLQVTAVGLHPGIVKTKLVLEEMVVEALAGHVRRRGCLQVNIDGHSQIENSIM